MKTGCLLIAPGVRVFPMDKGAHGTRDFPRGLLSLASFLNRGKMQARIIEVDNFVLDHEIGCGFTEIREKVKGSINEALNETGVFLVGIGFAYTIQFDEVREIARLVKEIAPEVIVVVGGPHPSFLPDRTLKEIPEIDIVVRGEGEWTLADLLSKLGQNVPLGEVEGITFRERSGEIVSTSERDLGDVNELPVLDYSLLDVQFLRNGFVNILASRGCDYNCTFCVERLLWRRTVRQVPEDNILTEINTAVETYNCSIAFEDSMFDLESQEFLDFCDKLDRLGHGSHLRKTAYLVSRVDCANERGLRRAGEVGIERIIFGIESGSEKVLKMMNKRITRDQIVDACKTAKDAGLNVNGFFIIGHPGDDLHEFEITYELAEYLLTRDLLDGGVVAKFIPYPGTAPFRFQEKYGVEILSYDWSKWGRFGGYFPVSQLKGFSSEDIHSCWMKLRELGRDVLTQKRKL